MAGGGDRRRGDGGLARGGDHARAARPAAALSADLLLLADGRFPAGGYAHSGGLEQAIEAGRVRDEATLHAFLVGALSTVGLNAAGVAAAACRVWVRVADADVADGEGGAGSADGGRSNGRIAREAPRDAALAELSGEESARIPSPALREASRAQGRQLLRAARATWPQAGIPAASVVPGGAHLSLAQGVIVGALGLGPEQAALLCGYSAITSSAAAAVKLLGLDPFAVNRVITALWPALSEVVAAATDLLDCAPADLPCRAAPALEVGAELHRRRELRMFTS